MDRLFEPVQVGPKQSRNRLWRMPVSGSEPPLRGQWGAVFLGETFMVPTVRLPDLPSINLFDDRTEIKRTVEGIHSDGALAGIELAYNPPSEYGHEQICKRYDDAAKLVAALEFDLVTLYAAHGGGKFLSIPGMGGVVVETILGIVPGVAIGIRTDDFGALAHLDSMVDYWDIVADGVYPDVFKPSPLGTKVHTERPVVNAGFTHVFDMQAALVNNECDIVGLARAALMEPMLPGKLANGEAIQACHHCMGCVALYEQNEAVICTER